MDDHSDDGSVQAVDRASFEWARIIVRNGPRGLSTAVLDGIQLSGPSGDRSHGLRSEPSTGKDPRSHPGPGDRPAVCHGFQVCARWQHRRSLGILQVAQQPDRDIACSSPDRCEGPDVRLLCIPEVETAKARSLNPVGYKIALELIVKCDLENVAEIPIHFADRLYGESKLTPKQQLLYLQHLRRLYIHRFVYFSAAAQFAVVGASGVLVNLAVLTAYAARSSPGFGRCRQHCRQCGLQFPAESQVHIQLRALRECLAPVRGIPWRLCAAGMVVNYATTLSIAARFVTLPAAGRCPLRNREWHAAQLHDQPVPSFSVDAWVHKTDQRDQIQTLPVPG